MGFYALNGASHVSVKKNSRADMFSEFLVEIREKNPCKRILVILDNFIVHKSRLVRDTAGVLDIVLLYLPPYSPDLNPIEYLWKSMKRRVSTSFLLSKEELASLILHVFEKLSSSLSFAGSWIKKFLNHKFKILYN